ncbi:MAG: hypothetical protein MN733_03550 [Nitrososphaera sp.]|nr:hypothetical protein [Nitrososphaera sp.]
MSALDDLAYAALEVEDLVNGVIGEVEISYDLEEIRRCHALFVLSPSWNRVPEMEAGRYSDSIEYRVYFNSEKKLWATIEALSFLGFSATFSVSNHEPY